MKNLKITQLKLNEESIESNYNKPRKYLEVSTPQKSKGKLNIPNDLIADLYGSQTTTNKNNLNHEDKAFSSSHIKKSEILAKNKANNTNYNHSKINLHVSTQTSNIIFYFKDVVPSFTPLKQQKKEGIPFENYNSLPNSINSLKKENENKISSETMKVYNSEKSSETMSVANYLNGGSNLIPISIASLISNYPNYENSKYSIKSMQFIKAYAANTNQGIIR